MKLLLDTNVVSKIIRGREPHVRERYRKAVDVGQTLWISSIVLHELRFGVLRSPDPGRNAERLNDFLAELDAIEPFTPEDAEIAAEIRTGLARLGMMIGPFDLLIAAHARRIDATIVTGNVREFSRIPGLQWIDWTTP